MTATGAGDPHENTANDTGHAGPGSLAQIARVDPWQVAKLGLLLNFWLLPPLILLLARPQLNGLQSSLLPLARQDLLWAVLPVMLVCALNIALAYSTTRRQALSRVLEHAMHNLPVRFAYVDANRCYRFNNQADLAASGLSSRAINGKPMRSILGERVYRQIEPYLDSALAGRREDFELLLPEGALERAFSITCLPDVASSGQVNGVFLLVVDTTRRKQAERNDRKQCSEIARLARMARVGESSAEIAHQINQPLAAIAMFSAAAARTLADGGDQAQVLGWLETISAQTKRAGEVVERLRRHAGHGWMEPGIIDLNDVLREAASLLANEASARNVAVELELTDDLPPVLATDMLIEQVAINLIRKAIRSAAEQTPPGRVTICSRAEMDQVWVEVLGDGAMPGACREEERESGGASADNELGLSSTICRSIIIDFEGEFGYRSDEHGRPSCFFHIPRYRP